jgi:cytoskeletal protein CcmA (bactofilin family)
MFKKTSKGILNSHLEMDESMQEFSSLATTTPFNALDALKNKVLYPSKEAILEPEIIIGENVRIEGSITFEKYAKIDGHFSGEIISKGKIEVGPNAFIQSDIFLEEAHISGTVEGNISVTKRLVLEGSAKVIGDITAPTLSVGEGVSIRGQLHVMKTLSPEETEEELPFAEEPLL